MKPRSVIALFLVAWLLSISLAACGGAPADHGHAHAMASLREMAPEVQQAPVAVQEAYRFAVANPDILEQIPCYCGCGAMGHTSNYSCYVAGIETHGSPSFDPHALGCSICVDITQDTMRLLDQGKSVPEIYAAVDQTYSRFGPPTPLNQG